MERTILFALASFASTLSRLAYDVCLFMSQNFGFVGLPDELTTGSSIMPHKKNPDVFELLRAHCNLLQSLPNQMLTLTNNLPSGYFRDMQLTKELFIPAFDELNECIKIAAFAIENMTINEHILDDGKYRSMYSVEEVNRLVLSGTPFRDAYREVGISIENGSFNPDKQVHHTHEGSIGNLCLESIETKMKQVVASFHFEKASNAIDALVK
jgi:argininosuccinate lyase